MKLPLIQDFFAVHEVLVDVAHNNLQLCNGELRLCNIYNAAIAHILTLFKENVNETTRQFGYRLTTPMAG
jgi:hypothetical protein